MTPDQLAAQLSPERFGKSKIELLQSLVLIGEAAVKRRTPVRKGTLRRSITGRVLSIHLGAVGTNLSYGPSVHRRIPFLTDGLNDARPEMERAAAAAGETFFASIS